MSTLHTVVLAEEYKEANAVWLRPFLFDMPDLDMYFFLCYSHKEAAGGFLEFEVHPKANAERQRILLPPHAVVAILLYQTQQDPFGFVHQEKSPVQ